MTSGPRQHDEATEQLEGAGRSGARAVIGWAAVVAGVVPFLVLWLLVRDSSSALAMLDRDIAAELNEAVRGYPLLVSTLKVVTDVAGTVTAVVLFSLITVFMAIQRHWRLALFAAVTGLGLSVLIETSKALIGRARPVVEVPVAETPGNASFPSGHSMTAVVLWGTVLLLTLPAVRRAVRPWLVGATIALVVVVGITRLALGVHFLSDVLAGWLLGAAWLAAMVIAFRTWPGTAQVGRALDPLDPASKEVVDVEHPRRSLAPIHGRDVAWLVAAAVLIAGVLIALGLLVKGPLADTWIGRWDRAVVDFMAEARGGVLTDVADLVNALGGTPTVIGVALAIAMLALAATGSWRPALFVTVAVGGEALLYFVVSRLVDRPRPDVPDLTSGLPVAASWPSGHVAAATVLYGALAAVLLRWSSSPRSPLVVAAVVVALGVAGARLYLAAHYPTDVLAGLVLGAAWLWACVRWLLPPRREASGSSPGTPRERVARPSGGASVAGAARSTQR